MNSEDKIKSILLARGILNEDSLASAELVSKAANVSILQYLISSGLIDRTGLGEVLAKANDAAFVDLGRLSLSRTQVLEIPEDVARKFNVILYSEDASGVRLASDNPQDKKLLEVVSAMFGNKAIAVDYAFEDDIKKAFVHYEPLESRLVTLLSNPRSKTEDIVDEIFREAVRQKVSDVHIEPHEKINRIRFRVDGILQTISEINLDVHAMVMNRIKILSNLRIDEHKASQDGAMRLELDGVPVDLRVSIIPTLEGEKAAVRVLSQYIGDLTLDELGLSPEMQKVLIETAQKPFGMILVTGPTSSGKTTTLYALLKLMNKPEVNITTIEDPVEYRVDGINQIQIDNHKVTFASGLRSIVRQDPNIVLLGEIRDSETVEIAVNAALTGHLLLSTFHANDAATSIPRLLDMGVEPFLVASTIQLVISQRLVRKICPNCKVSESYTRTKLYEAMPKLKGYMHEGIITLQKGTGCKKCNGSGYLGREAIYEFIKMGPKLQDLVIEHPSSKKIWEIAKKEGSRPLFEAGIDKVIAGITTIDEVMRVAAPQEED